MKFFDKGGLILKVVLYFVYYLIAFNKEIEKQQQKNGTSNRDACDALTVTGFAHTTATTEAMAALGVSGPVGWGVGAEMGSLYAGGSIACNHA